MIRAVCTLSDLLRDYYVPSRIDLAQESIRQMEITIRCAEKWHGGPLEVYDFSEDLLRKFLADYRRSHSAATTNSKRCHLLALWRCAFDEELIDRAPRTKKIRKAREADPVPEAWTVEQVSKILASAKLDKKPIVGIPAVDWWESLLLVLYDTGERKTAALSVEPQDLDLDAGWILFRRRKHGKTRLCPLSQDAIAACRKIYDPNRDQVWPWPCSREALDKRLKKILKRAGVPYGRGRGGLFHKFKRTAGSLVEAAGGDGAKFTGTTRKVFERHYRDPRMFSGDLCRLPRPTV